MPETPHVELTPNQPVWWADPGAGELVAHLAVSPTEFEPTTGLCGIVVTPIIVRRMIATPRACGSCLLIYGEQARERAVDDEDAVIPHVV
jgi:hypothetical protein